MDQFITQSYAGVILVTSDLKNVLMVKGHNYKWNFPHGTIRHDDNYLSAATRALYKQTGIGLNPTTVIGQVRYHDITYISPRQMLRSVDNVTKLGTFNYMTTVESVREEYVYFIALARTNLAVVQNEEDLIAIAWLPVSDVVKMTTDENIKRTLIDIQNKALK